MNQYPVMVVNQSTQRECGRKAQTSNILAAKAVSDSVRSCLGPLSMLKMMINPMGDIVLTNDGNCILREIEAIHPSAKTIVDLSRSQDEEVGDGTTSTIILTGEILSLCQPLLDKNIHPSIIIAGLRKALDYSIKIMKKLSVPIDVNDEKFMFLCIENSINTKFSGRWSDMIKRLALDAVKTVLKNKSSTLLPSELDDGFSEVDKVIDVKRLVRIEKIPGDAVETSCIIKGVVLNKDVVHPKMRREIENPRILLLDCPLEYKKGESATQIEMGKEGDWSRALEVEEEQIKEIITKILAFDPDLILCEKGVSDYSQHLLVNHSKQGVSVLRRVKKTDMVRASIATGASIVSCVDELKESDLGLGCQMFKIKKIGDESFAFLESCISTNNEGEAGACTIVLRGPSKDLLNELERDLMDALYVTRNLFLVPRVLPGAGATEMAISTVLNSVVVNADPSMKFVSKLALQIIEPYKVVAGAFDVIPRTLICNSGSDIIRTITSLRAKHFDGHHYWGVNGYDGSLVEMDSIEKSGVWEPLLVKLQTIKTSIEAASCLLKVDEILSAMSNKDKSRQERS